MTESPRRGLRLSDEELAQRQLDEEQIARALAQFKERVRHARTDMEAREVTRGIASLIRRYRVMYGVGLPESPVKQARQIDPGYVVRPHLDLLSNRIVRAVEQVEHGENPQIVVSMPPRTGKSMLTSLYAPLWMLRRHPEWDIVMTSYDGALTNAWARQIRHHIEDRPELGVALRRDGGAGGNWETVEGGGMYSVGIGGSLTGRGAKVMIIDDPVSDFAAAHSPRYRNNLWNWWLSVAQTRLEPPFLVIVVMCMTGDTPVLRPDGTETPLREIRPGDEIATYEDGGLVTSTVRNWASQGFDTVFAVRMESGRVVRANARHPFLTIDEDGAETWQRTDQLAPGSKVLSVEGLGQESSAHRMDAANPPKSRASAQPTTTRPDGLPVSAPLPSIPNHDALRGYATAMASGPTSLKHWLHHKTDAAPSVEKFLRQREAQHTGLENSASTTTQTPEPSGDSSATTAMSSSPPTSPPSDCVLPLNTWSVTPDRVVSVIEVGVEEVFDLQVDRTENFIANGLVSHNTRWHEDDFVGRLLSPDYEGSPADWQQIVLPALADRSDDILTRVEGEPLLSPLLGESPEEAKGRWATIREQVGTYTFEAMYQQHPAPAKGAIFDAGWWRYWTTDPSRATDDGRVVYLNPNELIHGNWLDSWDLSFKGEASSDYVVGQRWARSDANRYLIAQLRGRWSFTQTIEKMNRWAINNDPALSPSGHLVHQRIVESAANGPAVMDTLREKIAGIKAIVVRVSKESRARAVTPEIESGNVYLPHPSDPGNEWVQELLSELRNFPHDAHDDQVDALTQALLELRDSGRGGITKPSIGQRGLMPRSLTEAARTDLSRRRGR